MTLKLERAAAWLVLGTLLIGANLIGNLSAYISAITLLIMLPILLCHRDTRQNMRRAESLAYLSAFFLLLISFALSAKEISDIQYAGNFLLFLGFIPAIALFSTIAGQDASKIFATFALLGAIGSFAVGFYEVNILGIERVVGFVNLTNPFAMMSVMLGFLSLVGIFAPLGPWRFIFLLGPLFSLGAVLFAGTRAAIVMISVLTLLTGAFWLYSVRGRQRTISVLGGLALLTFGAVTAVMFGEKLRALSAFEALAVFFGQGKAVDFSTEIRLNLYYGGYRAFLDSPLFGHGWWHHFEAARPYMSEVVQQNTIKWSHLHNDYVNFAALSGIMGLVSYFLYMFVPVAGAIRSNKDSQYVARLYGASVIATSYAVFGMFDTSFSMELLLGFGPVCAAALLGFAVDQSRRAE